MGPSVDTHHLNARLLRFRSRPEHEDALALAEDLIGARRYGDARGVLLSTQAESAAQQACLLVLEGRAWYMDRDLERAQAVLLKAAKLDPQSLEAFRWLGEVLLKRGDPTRAMRAFERARTLGADDSELERLLERARQLSRHAPEDAAASPAPDRADAPPSASAAQPRIPSLPGVKPVTAPPALKPRAVKPVFARGEAKAASAMDLVAASRSNAPAPAAPLPPPPAAVLGAASRAPAARIDVPSAPVSALRERAADDFVDLSGGELDESGPSDTDVDAVRAPAQRTSSSGRLSSPGTRSSPGELASPRPAASPSSSGTQSSPGTRSSAGTRSSPGERSSPGHTSSPGTRSSPGSTSSPGRYSSTPPGQQSSPGTRSSPGTQSSPGRYSWSAPDRESSAGRKSSPGTRSSPAQSSPGTRSSPGVQSSPMRASSSAEVAAPADWSPAWATAPTAEALAPVDVEVDVELDHPSAAPRAAVATTPGIGLSPARPRGDLTPAHAWDAPSVVATWPQQQPLGADDEEEDRAAPLPEGDQRLGERVGQADDPAALLEVLRQQGIFEPPEADSPRWTTSHEVPRSGVSLRGVLIGVWVLTLAMAVGGYFGWGAWVAHRHEQAAQLIAEAKADAFQGDYGKLIDAERSLRLARDKFPRSPEVPRLELFVHEQRVLESGTRDLSTLRAALIRAERAKIDPAWIASARAVLAAYSGATTEAEAALKQALELAKGEPELLYVAGRLQLRMGQADGKARLQAAAAAAPALLAASLALAEGEQEQGREPEALAAFEAILKQRPDQLRAQLWRAFLTADAAAPQQAMQALNLVARDARAAAPIDRILWSLSRARLLRREGGASLAQAGEAVRESLAAGASEPRLLALVASEARRTGQLGVAQQAASQAVSAAPSVVAYRALLASIMIERHNGEDAFSLLQGLPGDEPAVLVMRARAALQTGDPDAERAAQGPLDAAASASKVGIELTSLRLRLHAATDPNPKLLPEAKALLRRAPGDPDALRALGEAALALREPKEALSAFDQLLAVAGDDAEAHYLLGRARRLAVDPKGAEASLRRALELSPGYIAAMVALGGLLLDTGKYAEADAVYQALATHSVREGRLGRAEALLGLGRVDDAQAQVSGLPEAQRDNPQARETGARVALARKKPGEALTLLRPLVEGENRRASSFALYGDALYAAEQINAAAGAYDSALELDSELPEALLGRGQVDLRAERFDEAVGLLEKAKSALATRIRAPEVSARMLTLLGRAYVQRAKRHDLELARDLLREAVKQPGVPAEAFFWLGEALGGRITPESAAAFKRYMELEPKGDYVPRAKRALGPLL